MGKVEAPADSISISMELNYAMGSAIRAWFEPDTREERYIVGIPAQFWNILGNPRRIEVTVKAV